MFNTGIQKKNPCIGRQGSEDVPEAGLLKLLFFSLPYIFIILINKYIPYWQK